MSYDKDQTSGAYIVYRFLRDNIEYLINPNFKGFDPVLMRNEIERISVFHQTYQWPRIVDIQDNQNVRELVVANPWINIGTFDDKKDVMHYYKFKEVLCLDKPGSSVKSSNPYGLY